MCVFVCFPRFGFRLITRHLSRALKAVICAAGYQTATSEFRPSIAILRTCIPVRYLLQSSWTAQKPLDRSHISQLWIFAPALWQVSRVITKTRFPPPFLAQVLQSSTTHYSLLECTSAQLRTRASSPLNEWICSSRKRSPPARLASGTSSSAKSFSSPAFSTRLAPSYPSCKEAFPCDNVPPFTPNKTISENDPVNYPSAAPSATMVSATPAAFVHTLLLRRRQPSPSCSLRTTTMSKIRRLSIRYPRGVCTTASLGRATYVFFLVNILSRPSYLRCRVPLDVSTI